MGRPVRFFESRAGPGARLKVTETRKVASDFERRFAASAMPKLLDVHGETITFEWPPDGASFTQTGIVRELPSDGSETRRAVIQISNASSTVSNRFRRGLRATLNGDTWMVSGVSNDYAGGFELECETQAEPRGHTSGT